MIYRDAEDALRQRREELRMERLRELEELPASALAVYTRRCGRSAAGAMGILFAMALALAAAGRVRGLTYILWLAWPAMIVAYGAAAIAAQFSLRMRLTGAFAADSDNPADDVARLEVQTPISVLRALCARLERRSVSLPMVAFSLLTPLSLHFIVGMLIRPHVLLGGFDQWICMCILLVGHTHLILAYHARRFAIEAGHTADPSSLDALARSAAWRAWGAIVWWSLLVGPGAWIFFLATGDSSLAPLIAVALLVVVPAMVAATATVFVPGMFQLFGSRLKRERLTLAALAPEMPQEAVEPAKMR